MKPLLVNEEEEIIRRTVFITKAELVGDNMDEAHKLLEKCLRNEIDARKVIDQLYEYVVEGLLTKAETSQVFTQNIVPRIFAEIEYALRMEMHEA
jgi:pyridoxal/pyridoxine/pyridoxamine kinase